jgi:hypothetical protein
MKHLKHIFEYSEEQEKIPWAEPNRLGFGYVTEITEESVKHSLKFGPPIRVKISPKSEYYEGVPANPINVIGTVIEFRRDVTNNIRVMWDNGESNSYKTKDLIIES